MVILDNCVGCGGCVPFCPFDAISTYGVATIDGEKCTECKTCISYCPLNAIIYNK
ncbi:MAG: hypothetical protein PWQ47_485 [Methanothermococcus sp.]|jgi:ferredoxin|nr:MULTISPECIES: 4Fe-4S binding protein [Methanothermococcus]MDK2987347.1 hypothetical protein [Methanothermococcus sp.]